MDEETTADVERLKSLEAELMWFSSQMWSGVEVNDVLRAVRNAIYERVKK